MCHSATDVISHVGVVMGMVMVREGTFSIGGRGNREGGGGGVVGG